MALTLSLWAGNGAPDKYPVTRDAYPALRDTCPAALETHPVKGDTRTPYVAQYDGDDAGKVAHYMLRWVNTKGEQGPWSQTVSATITG